MNGNQQKAFSLVELLVVIIVLAVLTAIAVPNFSRLLEDNRQESLRNLLIAQISQARTNAITHNRQHLLCGSSDGMTCNGDWSSYWLIMAMGKQPSLLHQQAAPAKNVCWNGFGGNSIRFHPNGTSPTSNGRFSICRTSGPHWQLILNRQGRVRQGIADNEKNCCMTGHPGA